MTTRRHWHAADLRAAARLASEGTAGLVDLVEAVHARIVSLPAPGAIPERTRGITGFVYQAVRGVTRGVGGSVDKLLGWLAPVVAGTAPTLPSPEREAVVAALNGVLGDHLAATANPLATPMALRPAGTPGSRVLVLLHGLCMHDGQWQRNGHDHGAWLAQQAGWTPVYLRYNSGLPILENGRLLATQLDDLARTWPQPIERLALLGHSMGGLVARSAIHSARHDGLAWGAQVTDLVCLGSPHWGAPLERAGHGVDRLLQATPLLSRYSAPFARLGQLRSAGITDLRHGLDLPLPGGVRCHAVAASLGRSSPDLKQHLPARLLGDGLVPVRSALGQHRDPAHDLGFAPERCLLVPGTSHLDLLDSRPVAQQLARWLA